MLKDPHTTKPAETRADRLRRLRGEAASLPDVARDSRRAGDRGGGGDNDEDADPAELDPRLVETLVPDPEVWRELGITSMSGFRWERDPDLDFPPAIKISRPEFPIAPDARGLQTEADPQGTRRP